MKLDVTVNGDLLGWLSLDSASGLFAFAYAPDWLAKDIRFPLSPALPLDAGAIPLEQHSATVRQFFQNLLPEGQALDDAAQANKVSKSNLMGLLIALGQETAGALSLSLADPPLLAHRETTKRLLSRDELSERIRSRPQEAFTVWDGKVRLSIAGHQDKIAVLEENQCWYLVDGDRLASTHILKPEPLRTRLQGMTSNELACMRLAQTVGLPTADIRLEWLPEPVVLICRFDRISKADGVQRLHCIDSCQALGFGVSMKYERPYGDSRDVQHLRDGASLPKLFALLTHASSKPAIDRLALLHWAIFQVLIGNTDAHGKNLSFFMDAGGLSLAPAYDLVCCLLYAGDGISDTLAMAIGDNFNPTTLTAYDWALMAYECQLNPKLVSRELKQLADNICSVWPRLQNDLLESGANPSVLEGIGDIILQQCGNAQKLVAEIPKVSRDLLK
ncbi:HipA domain-containing protein [Methylovulum psychrotolerans]|jgi:serine/threonine-protein kinase HipA|uniref:Toxin HipA n=1 Tax=Methylovulum psychrotolerans TaxID=1704499 RepID=A0A1Z4C4A5_9GAMM|nr:HipA domain-containing protein [Methylovulum psychrotolerans]ASF48349.1 toxin HipA [Methylovulum psychrotolerans]MBT9100446.1 HipA domain-containing protein [Methylovulum psychrotolerans]POZ50038.1 type II toxin-antitoxin system HipA family toxin [Methylovulum psychrotolerans]